MNVERRILLGLKLAVDRTRMSILGPTRMAQGFVRVPHERCPPCLILRDTMYLPHTTHCMSFVQQYQCFSLRPFRSNRTIIATVVGHPALSAEQCHASLLDVISRQKRTSPIRGPSEMVGDTSTRVHESLILVGVTHARRSRADLDQQSTQASSPLIGSPEGPLRRRSEKRRTSPSSSPTRPC